MTRHDDATRTRRILRGFDLLHKPLQNKGTAFTEAERDALGLRGLLPPRVLTQSAQYKRIITNFRRKTSPLEKYVYLISLQDRNERLFYRTLLENLEEMLPIVYTPTVGEACREFAHIFQRPRGLYVSTQDLGRVRELVANWPEDDVRIVVVTDGERILGLGDLGTNGMGIPIGKLSLYTACAGVDPSQCLPIMLDVGTENSALLADPLYLGLPQRRVRGEPYDALVDELVEALVARYPRVLIQFEDFGNRNAFPLLARYRDKICCFNDDIQGTAAVTLAGLDSAARIESTRLRDQTVVFLGAGAAATGIGALIASAMEREGLDEQAARGRCWFVDSKGLVVKGRDDLQEHKIRWAHDHEFLPDLESVVRAIRPTAIVGVSGKAGTFTPGVLEAMAELNARPIVFALSNPTSNAECNAEEAYRWTGGRAIFASGSPFAPVELDGRRFVPGQGNNAYIFPGVGLGVLASEARHVTDSMFHAAADALAALVSEEQLESGCVYPPLRDIRKVSAIVAATVARVAQDEGLARAELPDDVLEYVHSIMYDPSYEPAQE